MVNRNTTGNKLTKHVSYASFQAYLSSDASMVQPREVELPELPDMQTP